jgi:lipoprotein-anchoring transpeptidase ErfK/SrfK
LAIGLPILVCGLIAGGIYAASEYYAGEAVPGSMIGDTSVTGMSSAEIEAVAEELFDSTLITLKIDMGETSDSREVNIKPTAVNMKLDAAATAQNVIDKGKDEFILLRYIPMYHKSTNLSITYSPNAIENLLRDTFPDVFTDPIDPKVNFDKTSKSFVVEPGEVKYELNEAELKRIARETSQNPGAIAIKVKATSVNSPITDEAAHQAADKANAIISMKFTFSVEDGKGVSAGKADIAKIITLTPDDAAGAVNIDISEKEAVNYVNGKLTNKLGAKPVNRQAIQDGSGRTLLEIGVGEDGTKVADAENVAAQIVTALKSEVPLSLVVSLEKQPFGADAVVPEDGERWAEVNLSTQRAYFYEGKELLRECLISSGTAGHLTRVGNFKVWLKVRKQDMSGGSKEDDTYYFTPNVEWISYFDGGIAFHYAYWHNNFGHPMSHGCVNMKKDDAIFSYEYLQKGDRVIVHY